MKLTLVICSMASAILVFNYLAERRYKRVHEIHITANGNIEKLIRVIQRSL